MRRKENLRRTVSSRGQSYGIRQANTQKLFVFRLQNRGTLVDRQFCHRKRGKNPQKGRGRKGALRFVGRRGQRGRGGVGSKGGRRPPDLRLR